MGVTERPPGRQALDWDQADLLVAELSGAMAAWVASSREDTTPVDENSGNLVAMALMASQIVGPRRPGCGLATSPRNVSKSWATTPVPRERGH
jgi:hypothetical protein